MSAPYLRNRIVPLALHPDSGSAAVEHVYAVWDRPDERTLVLGYRLCGDLDRLAVPERRESVRRDGLWRHTCCECFVRRPGDAAYVEFNFSPSSEWASYRFDGYRVGMQQLELDSAPVIETASGPGVLALHVRLALPAPWNVGTLHLAFTAVVEGVDGAIAYWSLAHAPGKPDFHHAHGFVVELR